MIELKLFHQSRYLFSPELMVSKPALKRDLPGNDIALYHIIVCGFTKRQLLLIHHIENFLGFFHISRFAINGQQILIRNSIGQHMKRKKSRDFLSIFPILFSIEKNFSYTHAFGSLPSAII